MKTVAMSKKWMCHVKLEGKEVSWVIRSSLNTLSVIEDAKTIMTVMDTMGMVAK